MTFLVIDHPLIIAQQLVISQFTIACVQTSPLPQKKIGRGDVCTQASLLLLTMINDRLLIDVIDHQLVTSGNLGC